MRHGLVRSASPWIESTIFKIHLAVFEYWVPQSRAQLFKIYATCPPRARLALPFMWCMCIRLPLCSKCIHMKYSSTINYIDTAINSADNALSQGPTHFINFGAPHSQRNIWCQLEYLRSKCTYHRLHQFSSWTVANGTQPILAALMSLVSILSAFIQYSVHMSLFEQSRCRIRDRYKKSSESKHTLNKGESRWEME